MLDAVGCPQPPSFSSIVLSNRLLYFLFPIQLDVLQELDHLVFVETRLLLGRDVWLTRSQLAVFVTADHSSSHPEINEKKTAQVQNLICGLVRL